MDYTNLKCNAYECEHCKNGYCESHEAMSDCTDNLIDYLYEIKHKDDKK